MTDHFFLIFLFFFLGGGAYLCKLWGGGGTAPRAPPLFLRACEVSMVCDARSEGYGGYLGFDSHYASEGKRSVINESSTCSKDSTDVGRSSKPHFFQTGVLIYMARLVKTKYQKIDQILYIELFSQKQNRCFL